MERIGKALEKAQQARKPPPVPPPSTGSGAPGIETPAVLKWPEPTHQMRQEDLADHRVVAGLYHDQHADLFRHLRSQLLQHLSTVEGRSVGVCSSTAGEGKTLIATNLALSISLDVNYRVALVDLDLRRPSIHKYLSLSPTPGLVDCLSGRASLEECLVNPGTERLAVLPGGTPVRNSSEILSSPRMAGYFEDMNLLGPDHIIVYDLPPLLSSDDAIGILPRLAAVLLVVQEGMTTPGQIQRSLQFLDKDKLVGTVLNKSTAKNPYPYY